MSIDYDGFSSYLLRQDLRSTTIRKHLNALRFLEKRGISLEKNILDNFLITLKAEGKSGSYLNTFVFVLRLYGKFKNLDLKIKEFKRSPSTKATLSDDEIDAFLSLTRDKGEEGQRYYIYSMFWSLIADTGCRPGEVAKLKKEHIDWGRGVIQIVQSKTNVSGQVPIPPNHKDKLQKYLSSLTTDYLFPSKKGGNHPSMDGHPVIDSTDWHYDWKKRLKRLGIVRQGLTPYSFRHSYATRLLEEDVSLFHVKKLMRHNDLKSTLVYEHLTTKDLIKAQQKLPRIRRNSDPKTVLQQIADLVKSFHIEEDCRFHYRIDENDNSIRFEVYLKSLFFYLQWVTWATILFSKYAMINT